jgi:hypothetical protein
MPIGFALSAGRPIGMAAPDAPPRLHLLGFASASLSELLPARGTINMSALLELKPCPLGSPASAPHAVMLSAAAASSVAILMFIALSHQRSAPSRPVPCE